jgi:hypothetical protein
MIPIANCIFGSQSRLSPSFAHTVKELAEIFILLKNH